MAGGLIMMGKPLGQVLSTVAKNISSTGGIKAKYFYI
jgi:hypothetical protein